MIYLFSGDDTVKKLSSYEEFLKTISPDTEVFKFNRSDLDFDQIHSFYSGTGLFSKKSLVIFMNFCEYEETRSFILSKLSYLTESDNLFVFIEGKLNKSTLDSFKAARAELNVFELPKQRLEKFNNFLVANAFSAKDKLKLWLYFRQAVDAGVALEELVGVLFWKSKDMLIKKNFNRFTEAELKDFSSQLSYLLPDARSKGVDTETAFEQFLLKIV